MTISYCDIKRTGTRILRLDPMLRHHDLALPCRCTPTVAMDDGEREQEEYQGGEMN